MFSPILSSQQDVYTQWLLRKRLLTAKYDEYEDVQSGTKQQICKRDC